MAQDSALLDEISDMLINCPLFNHLQAADVKAIARHFGINNISKGETIFNEGDDGSFMCIVHEGRVSIVKSNQNGDPVIMGTEGPGRALGEMAVLDGERRSASCVAATDCVFLTLSREAMDTMLEDQPRVGAKILRAIAVSLSRRMRWTAGKLVDLTE
ncbi:MAG: cyclic nucleotide-binding domain-containing protein [Gallionellaceae bacterium]|nr:cyclic nucleotide-binding domain-containing protein [Gallionellaceae bacterium]